MENLHNNSPIVQSAKYAVVHENGDETWVDFDLDTATEMPQGKLYVFDCRSGDYIEVASLEDARAIEDTVCQCYACPPENPDLKAIKDAAKSRGVSLLGVSPTMTKAEQDVSE